MADGPEIAPVPAEAPRKGAPSDAENPAHSSDSCVVADSHARTQPHKVKDSSQGRITPKAKRATLETRVSTEKQGQKEYHTSHNVQSENLRARAKRYGWEVGTREHSSDVSGADGDADRLTRLRKDAKADKWDLVAFDNADRAFRSVLVGLQFIETMKGLGKEVWIGDACVTSANSDERFMLQVILAASELKRAKNQDAANHKVHKIRIHGMWYWVVVPRGYKRRGEA